MTAIDYTKLLAKIVPKADGEDVARVRTGVVNAINTDGTLNVAISGVVISNVARVSGVLMAVNDVVTVLTYRGAIIVLGPSEGGANVGWVGESTRTSAVGSITTSETVIQYVTFTAHANTRYEVIAYQNFQSSTANDLVQMRLRWIAGAALTTAGTQITSVNPNCDIANRGAPSTLFGTFVPGAGQTSVGVTAVRQSGSGTITMYGDAAQVNTIMVKAV